MKILAINGSPRKNGSGTRHLNHIKEYLNKFKDINYEILNLTDYEIKQCKGCMVCYKKGEDNCPLKDDYLKVLKKLNDHDAVIFYSPTYALSISGLIKKFFDRSSFIMHRPFFKGKYSICLSCVAAYGDKFALKVLNMIVTALGFKNLSNIGINITHYDKNKKYKNKTDIKIKNIINNLILKLNKNEPIKPKLFELIAFNYQKFVFSKNFKDIENDCNYWKKAGWTDNKAQYYYIVKINFIKKFTAKMITKILIKSGFIAV